jgi:hypothetical protein
VGRKSASSARAKVFEMIITEINKTDYVKSPGTVGNSTK